MTLLSKGSILENPVKSMTCKSKTCREGAKKRSPVPAGCASGKTGARGVRMNDGAGASSSPPALSLAEAERNCPMRERVGGAGRMRLSRARFDTASVRLCAPQRAAMSMSLAFCRGARPAAFHGLPRCGQDAFGGTGGVLGGGRVACPGEAGAGEACNPYTYRS